MKSTVCGCFYCLEMFPPTSIVKWTDAPDPLEVPEAAGQTALCPHCGIDSVIGDASGTVITNALLKRMHSAYFEL